MNYVVVEIQSGDTITALVNTYTNQNEAEAKYHDILRFAALSNIPRHSATLLTDEGYYLKYDSYEHKLEETNE